jgi:hypothetical protein
MVHALQPKNLRPEPYVLSNCTRFVAQGCRLMVHAPQPKALRPKA